MAALPTETALPDAALAPQFVYTLPADSPYPAGTPSRESKETTFMTPIPRLFAIVALLAGFSLVEGPLPAAAQSNDTYPAPAQGDTFPAPQNNAPAAPSDGYTSTELINTGHSFFGQVTEGLASVVEHAVASYGLPNGYILGQEGAGAIVGGLRYGEGSLHTKNAGQHQIYWQGPSIGFDIGAEGNRTMMLVYNLPSIEAMHNRFAGVAGSAYLVAGVGMTVLAGNGMYVVPIVSGVGARLGINIGYLKFTPNATWNPF
jgi:hypothetical protein